jgi:hypothetical protein
MKIKFEHSDAAAKAVLSQVKKLAGKLNLPREVVISVSLYRNGIENGYKLVASGPVSRGQLRDRAVWFSENCYSDHIVVYQSRDDTLCYSLIDPTEIMFRHRRYFAGDDITSAARHIINFLLYGAEESHRVMGVRHFELVPRKPCKPS